MNYDLKFDEQKYTIETITLDNKTLKYRAFENIIYVKYPVDTNFQKLSIFVPETYYAGNSIGNYNLKTAPIFLPNTVGGYMPGAPEKPGINKFLNKPNATFYALLNGYVVVAPGVRGRGLKDKNGNFTGTAPACIVDLKAAVRYLRHNKYIIPGDVEKIISNGTSAGGALSSLLGSTGNHSDYEPYLKELGAANERDDIFAASCYCPITNLENADKAYEWEFCGINDYHKMKFEIIEDSPNPNITPLNGEMNELQVELSKKLKSLFSEYLNKLNLKSSIGTLLTIDSEENGTFKDYIKYFVVKSAQKELEKGTDLSDLDWLTIKNNTVININFDKYIKFRTRMKDTPAFDNISMGTPENELFGTPEIQYRHFTEFSKNHSIVNGQLAEDSQIKLMNPMNYISDKSCNTAKNFRIRHGAIDRDTSLSISAILAITLEMNGVNVDYEIPWGVPHSGDYDLKELFAWIDDICS